MALVATREPMFALLLGSGVIYFVLGSLGEATLLLLFACSSVGIAIIQEGRSERVLDSLRELTSPRALVIRDGKRSHIPSREIVRGDLIVLVEGDRVPADAVVRMTHDLQVDESLLTGESVPIQKYAANNDVLVSAEPSGEGLPFVFSSTLVVRGSGLAEVLATGPRSKIGKIGGALASIEAATPRLTSDIRQVVRAVAIIAIACCVVAVVLFGIFRGSWLQAFLAGIALGMAMIPEEFPLVLTVFTAMGAWRLSRARVLTRRAAAIETLGAATVLCTDKTGTITENRMSIAEIRSGNEIFRCNKSDGSGFPDYATKIIRYGILASAVEPFDPMEKAFFTLQPILTSHGAMKNDPQPAKIYPLRQDLLAVTQAWENDAGSFVIATKGAPETILGLCRIEGGQAEVVRQHIDVMAGAGMRVLGVAEARHSGPELPDSPTEYEFRFLGLVGLADPIRASVPAAIRDCQNAGIRVIMITGDYPLTAHAIALQAGLPEGEVVTGSMLDSLSDIAFAEVVDRVNVFARIAPEQKLRLVQALRAHGQVVAMTGDGVNDAPALRSADIGVSMGNRGTDVAREASALVLLDDDFTSIVRTIRLGRRIYDNLRKAMGYIIAVHIPIAGMSLLPLLTGLPLVFSPVHIALLELIIDPVCSVVFEAEQEESNIMRRPPRSPSVHLLSPMLIQWSVIQGCASLLIIAAVYFLGYMRGMGDEDLRTLTFITLVCGNLCLVLVNRKFSAGGLSLIRGVTGMFWAIAATATAVLIIAIQWPWAGALFGFGSFQSVDIAYAVFSAFALLIILEGMKIMWPRQFQAILAA
jgi:Ca2+-transporting ATPase